MKAGIQKSSGQLDPQLNDTQKAALLSALCGIYNTGPRLYALRSSWTPAISFESPYIHVNNVENQSPSPR